MRIEFFPPPAAPSIDDAPPPLQERVGSVTWDGRRVLIDAPDEQVRAALERIFRPAPVVTTDASYRRQGTRGEVVLEPGSSAWFRAAAFARAPEAGLVARVVPGVVEGGWDPAAQYRTFGESIDRLEPRS